MDKVLKFLGMCIVLISMLLLLMASYFVLNRYTFIIKEDSKTPLAYSMPPTEYVFDKLTGVYWIKQPNGNIYKVDVKNARNDIVKYGAK